MTTQDININAQEESSTDESTFNFKGKNKRKKGNPKKKKGDFPMFGENTDKKKKEDDTVSNDEGNIASEYYGMIDEEQAKYKVGITPDFDEIRKEIRESAYGDKEVPKKLDLINHPNMKEKKLSFMDLDQIESIETLYMAAQDLNIAKDVAPDIFDTDELPDHSDMTKKVLDIKQAIDLIEYINKQRETPENLKLSMLGFEEMFSGTGERYLNKRTLQWTDDINDPDIIGPDHVTDLSKVSGGSEFTHNLYRTDPKYQDQLSEIDRLDDQLGLYDELGLNNELELNEFSTSESPRIIEFDHEDKRTMLDLGTGKRKSRKSKKGKWSNDPKSTMKVISTSDKPYKENSFDIDGTTLNIGTGGNLDFIPSSKMMDSGLSQKESGFKQKRSTI